MTVDPRAATGFADEAEAYERGRPGYPEPALDVVCAGLGPQGVALDLAAGTGKLTRALVPRVGTVVAVDPSAGMRAELARRVPGVEVRDGTAEAIPAPDAAFDAVFVAEAFHWFQAEAACAEIARVLRPGGRLALLTNQGEWDLGAPRWLPGFRELFMPVRDAAGPPPTDRREWAPVLRASGRFDAIAEHVWPNVQRQAPEDFVAQISSFSWVANMSPDRRREVLGRVSELVADEDEVVLHYRTEATTARARPA